MRITNMMMINSMNYTLSRNLESMNTQYIQMSTGKSFQKASDNPVAASKSMLYTSELSEIEQYQSNASDATSRLSVIEASINSAEEILERTRELTVQAANETLSSEDLSAIAAEIIELNDQLMEISNTTYAGQSLFGGYNVTENPFVTNEDGVLLYNDEALTLTGPYSDEMSDEDILALYDDYDDIQVLSNESDENLIYRIGDNSEVDVNVEGQELFGTGETSTFSVMKKIEMAMLGKTSYKEIDASTTPPTINKIDLNMSSLIGELDSCLDNIRATKAEVGARQSYVELSTSRLNQDYYTYTALLSANEDADIAEVSMNLANAESVYNASLAAGSKIILPTLADFIG